MLHPAWWLVVGGGDDFPRYHWSYHWSSPRTISASIAGFVSLGSLGRHQPSTSVNRLPEQTHLNKHTSHTSHTVHVTPTVTSCNNIHRQHSTHHITHKVHVDRCKTHTHKHMYPHSHLDESPSVGISFHFHLLSLPPASPGTAIHTRSPSHFKGNFVQLSNDTDSAT